MAPGYLLPARTHIDEMFKSIFGVDYGMPIGMHFLRPSNIPPFWFGVVLITGYARILWFSFRLYI